MRLIEQRINEKRATTRSGYVFLITVLVIGVIALGTVLSLLLLGLAAEQSGFTIAESAQGYEFASTCAEQALQSLRSDLTYDGGETLTFTRGSCIIHRLEGAGNADRILCVEGRSGQAIRRLEISLRQLYPRVRVVSWKEVADFSACPS